MPSHSHDFIVIGGGAAGLTAAGMGASLGAKTALVERARLGGDCTWTGCVPSKALLHAAHVRHHAAKASRIGLADTDVPVDFARLMAHVRTVRQEIYDDADDPAIFEAMGVDVRHGSARFVDPHTVELTTGGGAERISAPKILLVTGGRPAEPPVPGLAETPHLTSETLFEITEQPQRLVVLGGGPIGVEMAQAFTRLGTEVALIDRGDRILGKDDAELAEMLRGVLAGEGVTFHLGADATRVARDGNGVAVTVRQNGREAQVTGDALLVAVGRQPNVEGLGLDAAGVSYSSKGIDVDGRGRTNVSHIFAAGDVTGQFALTHMSEHTAKTAATNLLLRVPASIDAAHVPWATYADPELAHVGATEAQLNTEGARFTTYRFPYRKVDRAVVEGEAVGMIKVHATVGGTILGASVLGARAGDLIGELGLAMRNGVSLRQISDTIHPYPTYGLGVRRAADQWYVQRRSRLLVRGVQTLFGYDGPVQPYEEGDVV